MLPESDTTEYKRELCDTLEKDCVSFLNSKTGGTIYIGVADDLTVRGVDDIDSVQLQAKDRFKKNISPPCLGFCGFSVSEQDGKHILKMEIASGWEKP